MGKQIPVYREGDKIYHADSCKPLIRAVKAGTVQLSAVGRGSYPGRGLSDSELPQVRSLAYWDALELQDWGLDWHLENGSLDFALIDRQYLLQAGDLTITRPWQPHRLGNPYVRASRLHWLILDLGVRRPNQPWKWPDWLVLIEKDIEDLTLFMHYNKQPVWSSTPEIRFCFQQIAQTLDSDREGSNISRLTVHLNELFVCILEMFRQKKISLDPSLSNTSRTVKLFLADLRNNPQNLVKPWTLREMAERCGLGETRFRHYCKKLTNMTPIQFLEHCRVETASKMLIENPRMAVTEIALACGFGSSQYFATVFKRHHGNSPKAFRKKAR
jgi:AraC-like DNA-binding protein